MKPTFDMLDQIADVVGIEPATTVALMSALLNGLVGPVGRVTDFDGFECLPHLNLAIIGDDGTVAEAVRSLTECVLSFQREQENRFRGTSPRRLREVLISLDPERGQASDEEAGGAMSVNSQILAGYPWVSFGVAKGYAGLFRGPEECCRISDQLANHLDFRLRPKVFLENLGVQPLSRQIMQCHRENALVYGGKVLTLSDIATVKWRGVYGFLCYSATSMVRSRLKRPSLIPHSPTCSLIFHGEAADWRDWKTPYYVKDVLLIEGGVTCRLPRRRRPAALAVWNDVLKGVLLDRSNGWESFASPPSQGFEGQEFQERFRSYLEECSSVGVCSEAIRALPLLVHNLFDRLGRCLLSNGMTVAGPAEVFHFSEILRRRDLAVRQRLELPREQLEIIHLAERIRDRLQGGVALTLRQLVRTFNQQRKELYLPTLNKMVEAGLVERVGKKTYRLSSEEDVEGAIRRLFDKVQTAGLA